MRATRKQIDLASLTSKVSAKKAASSFQDIPSHTPDWREQASASPTGYLAPAEPSEKDQPAEDVFGATDQNLRLIIDSIPGLVSTMTAAGEIEFVNQQILDYFGETFYELKVANSDHVHPDDLPRVIEAWRRTVETGQSHDVEFRLRRADGVYRWFEVRRLPLRDADGHIVRWLNLRTDIDDRKRAEEALRANEQRFHLAVDSIPGLVTIFTATGEPEFVNQQILDYFGKTVDELKGWANSDHVHPDDLPRVIEAWRRTVETGQPFEMEHRLRRPDGVYRWFHARALPLRDTDGRIIRWYSLLTDIDDRKRAEDKLQRSEWNLLEAQRLGHSGSWSHDLSSRIVTSSPEMIRVFDAKPAEDYSKPDFWLSRIHPDDRERVQDLFERCVIEKTNYQAEYRLLLPDGTIKYQHCIGYPVLNEAGEVVEFVGTAMDTTEQVQARIELEKAFEEIKRLKDRLHEENLALREQIDQAFMFEEIVGSSPALQTVLSSIVRVAPTDSTVMVTGETGTGKELIARAIHKRSQRAAQPFISVNCGSIPSSLIASELFGHEKGAFTGALQRRNGRFELAHSGTIFLDEIGELPADTQTALLRVLQERQFERVGGNRPIPTDVRVIAATNRNLKEAIASRTLRADLFYRLNVFPIHVPPLRQRREDIPMLVEYFVKRYAEKARKQINKIGKKTLMLCQSYQWPGNIRELQNIVERAVILCNGDTFSIDEAWLSSEETPGLQSSGNLTEVLHSHEEALIKAALAESNGKVAGPNGAAAKLGIPRSTLDAKIKKLKISVR